MPTLHPVQELAATAAAAFIVVFFIVIFISIFLFRIEARQLIPHRQAWDTSWDPRSALEMAVVELLAAAEPPSAEEFKRLNLSDCCYLVATTKDDCHFELADFIASMVVQFLGVRSLAAFGATSKSHRAALANEVDRRKACIAEIEVEVTNLMASEKQSAKLSAYINRAIHLYGNGEGSYDGDGLDEMHSHLEEENGEVEINNPSRDNFLAAKILVYNAMHLIDDEVGIFHKRLVTTDDGTEYFDIWEDVRISDHSDHEIAFPFGIDEPGDKINIFREERSKFFSRPMQGQAAKGALFSNISCSGEANRGWPDSLRGCSARNRISALGPKATASLKVKIVPSSP